MDTFPNHKTPKSARPQHRNESKVIWRALIGGPARQRTRPMRSQRSSVRRIRRLMARAAVAGVQ